MIITVSGYPGAGKSTAARLVAKKLRYKHYSIGGLMRQIARSRKMSILQLSKIAEGSRAIDQELDRRTVELGKNEDNFVLDSRLGYHFIPHSLKVFLKVSEEEAARRIFKAKRPSEQENTTLEETRINQRKRMQSEKLRYKKFYGLDPYDEKQYDLIIDTTNTPPEGVAEKIISSAKLQMKHIKHK